MATRFVSSSPLAPVYSNPSQRHSTSCRVGCFTENSENSLDSEKSRACTDLKGSCTPEVTKRGPTGLIQSNGTARSYHYSVSPIIHPPSGGPPKGKQGLGGWMGCHTNPHSLPLGFLALWPDTYPLTHLPKKGPHIILYPLQIFTYRQRFTEWLLEWPCSAASFLHLIHCLTGEREHRFLSVLCQLFHRAGNAAFCNQNNL